MPSAAERQGRARPREEGVFSGVLFKNVAGNRTRRVKPGFAWDLFLLTPLLGAPAFLRGLPNWGAAVLGLWVADMALGKLRLGPLHWVAEVALFAGFLGLQLYLGFKGNALTAQACKARGWIADNLREPGVRQTLAAWGID